MTIQQQALLNDLKWFAGRFAAQVNSIGMGVHADEVADAEALVAAGKLEHHPTIRGSYRVMDHD